MFKFMKSKKGFTLVELMIVVVIMAILVAVAVPIFSAVTKNARIKTCEANRREIVSQLNNYAMGAVDGEQHTYSKAANETKADITITINDAGEADVPENNGYIDEGTFNGLFQKVPACPKEGATITVTIKAVSAIDGVDQTANFVAACNSHTGEDNEVDPPAADGE